jgi:hypothetical protein
VQPSIEPEPMAEAATGYAAERSGACCRQMDNKNSMRLRAHRLSLSPQAIP